MKQFFYTLTFFLVFFTALQGQDQHFTQFFAAPLTLNPALSGAFNGNYRLGVIYRDQGGAELQDPYLTFATAIDLRFRVANSKSSVVTDAFGAGITFYNDRVPNFDVSTNQMNIAGAYHKYLGKAGTQFLSAGFQVGIAQKNINYEDLTFDDQFDGNSGYTIPTEENLPENNFAYSDLAAGVNYAFLPTKGISVYAGFAVHHFNNPQVSFYFDKRDDVKLGDSELLTKYTGYLSLNIPIAESVQLHPRGLLYMQGEHLALNAGSNFRFLFNDVNGTALHLGGWARPVRYENDQIDLDAIIMMAGLEYNNFLLGLSYDMDMSGVNSASSRLGAFEISIVYLGNYENELILCPKF